MNIILIYAALRPSQTAATRANDDGTYTIFINRNKSTKKQIGGIFHELRHIKQDDFASEEHVALLERLLRNNESSVELLADISFYPRYLCNAEVLMLTGEV